MHPYVNFLENISCWFLCLKIAEMFEQSLGKINRFAIVIERQIFIIAGCNGAGKTTMVKNLLPQFIPIEQFINADEIAAGMSPFHPSSMAIEAGRWMLKCIHDQLNKKESFAFETTLATKSYARWIEKAQKEGYQANLLFLWLSDVEMAKQRVQRRVKEGGHDIPTAVIERRYRSGTQNFFELYLPIMDQIIVIDNSNGVDAIIAKQTAHRQLQIIHEGKWKEMMQYGRK
jgi:predicted ABC-type ATPase